MTPFVPPAPPANAPRFSAKALTEPTPEMVAIVAQCARDLIRAAEPRGQVWSKVPIRTAGWGDILARAIDAGVPVALADKALEALVYERDGGLFEPVLATVAEVSK